MMSKEWIEISEALNIFDVSESTLRRYINKHKDNKETIQKNKNKYILNYSKLLNSYHLSQTYSNDWSNEQETKSDNNKENDFQDNDQLINEFSERYKENNYIVKHTQNIIEELIKQREQTPFYKHSTFWTAITSIVIIAIIIFASWLYRKELIQSFNQSFTTTKAFYEEKLNIIQTTDKKVIESLNDRINELKGSVESSEKNTEYFKNELAGAGTRHDIKVQSLQSKIEELQQQINILKNTENDTGEK
jgi:hypothetical protein